MEEFNITEAHAGVSGAKIKAIGVGVWWKHDKPYDK